MNPGKSQTFVLIFEDGLKTQGEMTKEADITEIRFLLPHLNPGARMRFMNNVEARTSCTIIGEAVVLRIEGVPDQEARKPLRIRVFMKTSERDFSSLPEKGKIVTLMPENGQNAIIAECNESDAKNGTFCATYEMQKVVPGTTAELSSENGESCKVVIDGARFACLNSGINSSECVLTISKMEALPKEAPIEVLPKAEPETIEPQKQTPDEQDEVPLPEKKIRFAIGGKTKVLFQVILAALILTNLIILVAPSDGCADAGVVGRTKTGVAASSSAEASDGKNNRATELASVMILGATDSNAIAMTAENLRVFYFQSDPTKMPGSISGMVPPESLGILCDKSPVYDANEKTSDASNCKIALPSDTKPGIHALTAEMSAAWFHQADPSCFVEAVLPYYSSPEAVRSGLRINVESCEWRFDPNRKCFDYSKCTFTVPQFTAE
jgi:hypothetical protein